VLQVIKHLKFSGVMIDQHYEEAFERAILTFQHQRVYDPSWNNIVHLTDAPNDLGTDLDFLGPYPLLCS
jgi:exonuclease-1